MTGLLPGWYCFANCGSFTIAEMDSGTETRFTYIVTLLEFGFDDAPIEAAAKE